jgi:hypothetical protein
MQHLQSIYPCLYSREFIEYAELSDHEAADLICPVPLTFLQNYQYNITLESIQT